MRQCIGTDAPDTNHIFRETFNMKRTSDKIAQPLCALYTPNAMGYCRILYIFQVDISEEKFIYALFIPQFSINGS